MSCVYALLGSVPVACDLDRGNGLVSEVELQKSATERPGPSYLLNASNDGASSRAATPECFISYTPTQSLHAH